MPIRVLPADVAARIAAGEVVEGPASVVKELVENSLDAGASAISVELEAGGLELIRVADNGAGVAASDVPCLFQRHATSKLGAADELEAIATLGFRGEFLHSLAAVAWVAFLTQREGEASGSYVEARDGQVLRREPRGSSSGTSVSVRHLFHRLPARRKFLRSPQAELGRVQRLLGLYILAYPGVRFTLITDGRTALVTPGNGDMREAARAVHGATVAQELLEVAGQDQAGVHVAGLASPPNLHRANRSYISLFVNGRPVQSRSLSYAVTEAYHGLLPAGRSPVALLFITVPVQDVDANVHPAKAEVRFRNDSQVFSALQRSVREALVAQAPVPVLQPTSSPGPAVPRGPWRWSTQPTPPAPATPSPTPERPPQPAAASTRGLDKPSEEGEAPPGLAPSEPAALPFSRTLPALRVVGQVQETYIVAEGPDGMYLIDQHAAHECVLYERVHQAAEDGSPQVQGLLEPEVVELSLPQAEAVAAHVGLLASYGWQVEPFGPRSYLVRGMPAVLTQRGPAIALTDLVDALLGEESARPWEERVAATVACHGAVRAGTSLTAAEMVELVRLLEQARQPHTCPHGRPTMVHLSASHLEREFRRR